MNNKEPIISAIAWLATPLALLPVVIYIVAWLREGGGWLRRPSLLVTLLGWPASMPLVTPTALAVTPQHHCRRHRFLGH